MNPTDSKDPAVSPLGVFLIDDHPLIREGLTKVISAEHDMKVVGESGGCRGALATVQQSSPDVILVDLSLKDGSGLELIKDLRAAGIGVPVIVLSMHDEALYAERALKAGANGYLMKDEAPAEMVNALRYVMRGEIYLSARMSRLLLRRFAGGRASPASEGVNSLTDRELEVLELLGRGQSCGSIAATLGISPRTVGAHRTNIREKLGIASGGELVRYAVQWVDSKLAGEGGGAPDV